MKSRTIKRTIFAVLSIAVNALALMYWPVSIEGFWESPFQVWGPAVSFFLFQDGKVLHYKERDEYIAWCADYEKIGWGKYQIHYHNPEQKDSVVYGRLFKSKNLINGFETKRIQADSRCIEVFNNKDLRWLTRVGETCVIVTDHNDSPEYIYRGTKVDLKHLEDKLVHDIKWKNNFKSPLRVYSSTNYIPHSIIASIEGNGFTYVLSTNQNWIMELDVPYIRVSKTEDSCLGYSIKFKRDHQHDLQNVDLARVEIALRQDTEGDFRWIESRPRVLDIITDDSCDIKPLLSVMERSNQSYNVVTNTVWIERTDRYSWSLIYFEGPDYRYYNFNGRGYYPKDAEAAISSFQRYKLNLDCPFVVYAPNKQMPMDLSQLLDSKGIPFTINPRELIEKRNYLVK